jgi:hypothetical protein
MRALYDVTRLKHGSSLQKTCQQEQWRIVYMHLRKDGGLEAGIEKDQKWKHAAERVPV